VAAGRVPLVVPFKEEAAMADTSRIPGMQELYDFAASLDDTQRAAFFALIGDGSSVPPAADRLKFAQTLSNDTQRTEFFALFGSTPKPVVDLDNFTRKQIQQELDQPGTVAGLKGVPRDELQAYLNPRPVSRTRTPRSPRPARPARRPSRSVRSRLPQGDNAILDWLGSHIATLICMVVGVILWFVFGPHLIPLIGVTTKNSIWWVNVGLFFAFILTGGLFGNWLDRRRRPDYYYRNNGS